MHRNPKLETCSRKRWTRWSSSTHTSILFYWEVLKWTASSNVWFFCLSFVHIHFQLTKHCHNLSLQAPLWDCRNEISAFCVLRIFSASFEMQPCLWSSWCFTQDSVTIEGTVTENHRHSIMPLGVHYVLPMQWQLFFSIHYHEGNRQDGSAQLRQALIAVACTAPTSLSMGNRANAAPKSSLSCPQTNFIWWNNAGNNCQSSSHPGNSWVHAKWQTQST